VVGVKPNYFHKFQGVSKVSKVQSQKGKALARLHEATADFHLENRQATAKAEESYRQEYIVHRSIFQLELSELFLSFKDNQEKIESSEISATEKAEAVMAAEAAYDAKVEEIVKIYRADLAKRAEAFHALKKKIDEKLAADTVRYQNIYMEEFFL